MSCYMVSLHTCTCRIKTLFIGVFYYNSHVLDKQVYQRKKRLTGHWPMNNVNLTKQFM